MTRIALRFASALSAAALLMPDTAALAAAPEPFRREFLVDTSRAFVSVPGDQFDAAIAWGAAQFLVVWVDCGRNYQICGCRVAADGTPLDSAGFRISPLGRADGAPAVAFDGTNFLVVWQDGGSGSNDIHAARVSPQGTLLDTMPIRVSTAPGDQSAPAVAFDGSNFLIAWQDGRSDAADICACRISPQGSVLEPAPIRISAAPGDQSAPAVAFDGSNFLIAWQDSRRDAGDIYACRVSPQGTLLDSVAFCVVAAAGDQCRPAVAGRPGCLFVTWQDGRDSAEDIYACRVAGDGAVLDPQGIPVSTIIGDQHYPALAAGPSSQLSAWCDGRIGPDDVFGTRITAQGEVLDPEGVRITTAASNQSMPVAAGSGLGYLVAWCDERIGPYQEDIYAGRLSPEGARLDPRPIPVSCAVNRQFAPSVAAGDSLYLVAWTDERTGGDDVYAARVTASGALLDPGGIPVAVGEWDERNPAVAFDGTQFLVAWQDGLGGLPDIYAGRVTRQGEILDTAGFLVCGAPGDQRDPAIAFDGTRYLVVWTDRRSGIEHVYASRVSRQSEVLDPTGIAVSVAANTQQHAAVSCGGGFFFVVWEDGRNGDADIYSARITPQGTVLDPTGLPLAMAPGEQLQPAITFDGTDFIVVWRDVSSGEDLLRGCRVQPDGRVVDAFPAVQQPGCQQHPALASGSGVLLVYEGWTDDVAGKVYNANRIWGTLGPFNPVAEETPSAAPASRPLVTLCRGVLNLSPSEGWTRTARAELLDASGRRVANLYPGLNDLRRLAPGAYFIRVGSAGQTVTRKLLILS